MGAYNTLEGTATCPSCGALVPVVVQFKFGATRQFRYVIGDQVRWGANEIGEKGHAKVVVDAVAETICPKCGYGDEWSFYIHIDDNVISALTPADGSVRFGRKTFSVIDGGDANS